MDREAFAKLAAAHAAQHPDFFADGFITFSEFVHLQKDADEYISTETGKSLLKNAEHLLTQMSKGCDASQFSSECSLYRHMQKHGIEALAKIHLVAGSELFAYYDFAHVLEAVDDDTEALREITTLAEELGPAAKKKF